MIPVLPDTAHETIQMYVSRQIGDMLYAEERWWSPGSNGAWQPMPSERIWSEVRELNGLPTLEGEKEDKPGKTIKVTAGMCESVEALARSRWHDPTAFHAPTPGFIAADVFWTLTNGVGWESRRAVPADRVRMFVEAPADMVEAPRLWFGVLFRLWGHEADFVERCTFLAQWVGAMLCGLATRYQVALILVGDGNNGKSVLTDVIAALVPWILRCNVTPDDLESNRFAAATLAGKALNCVSEIPGSELLGSSKIKSVIDGSELDAERKNRDSFKFRPTAGHIFSANSLPHVRDLSYGFWRRWRVLTCTALPISEGERRLTMAADIASAEAGRIVGWAMRALEEMMFERASLAAVPSSDAAIRAWRGDSDSVQAWVEDAVDPGPQTSVRVLYGHYCTHSADTGTKAVALRTFGMRLAALGYPPMRTMHAKTRGLVIRTLQ